MSQSSFEVRGDWMLTRLPEQPAPWMVEGRAYAIVLRRRSADTLPEAVVHDRDTGAVLGVYSWRCARQLFTATHAD